LDITHLRIRTSPPASKQHGERPYPILHAFDKVCLVSTFTIIVFFGKQRPRRLVQADPGAGQSPPTHPRKEDEKGKDTQVSSLARISYGAQELAVFLFADSPSPFE
jgi:hypothetical protein